MVTSEDVFEQYKCASTPSTYQMNISGWCDGCKTLVVGKRSGASYHIFLLPAEFKDKLELRFEMAFVTTTFLGQMAQLRLGK